MTSNLPKCPVVESVAISAKDAAYIAGAPVNRLMAMVANCYFPEPLDDGKKPLRFDHHEVLQWAQSELVMRAEMIRAHYVSDETFRAESRARRSAIETGMARLRERFPSLGAAPVSNVIYPAVWHSSRPVTPAA